MYNLSIFRTLVYSESWHIQNQRHIQNPGISKTLAHSEQKNIQNPGLFRILEYAELEADSKPCQTSLMECFEKQLTAIIILTSFNYVRNVSFLSLVHEIDVIF